MVKLKHVFFGTMLLLLFAITGWYFSELNNESDQKKDHEQAFSLKDLTVKQFDEKGQVVNQLLSPHALHFQGTHQEIINLPKIMVITANALHSTNKEKLYLQADKLIYLSDNRQAQYLGHVLLNQGQNHLTASKALTTNNTKQELVKAIAKGTSHARVHFWRLSEKKEAPIHAYADTITYLPDVQQIQLEGHASIKQGENVYQSSNILYDIKREEVVSIKRHQKRTHITLDSKTI